MDHVIGKHCAETADTSSSSALTVQTLKNVLSETERETH